MTSRYWSGVCTVALMGILMGGLRAQAIDPSPMDVDDDDDGLIELYAIEDLDNIRYNLSGTSYKTSLTSEGVSTGCPTGGCFGYELVGDLDFAVAEHYAAGAVDLAYRPLSGLDPMASGVREVSFSEGKNRGWLPIGSITEGFTGTFEGNGFTIANLYVHNPASSLGGFMARLSTGAKVLNLGLSVFISSESWAIKGGLAAVLNGSGVLVRNCSVRGTITGLGVVGLLAGILRQRPVIENCFTTGVVDLRPLVPRLTSEAISGGGIVGNIGLSSTDMVEAMIRNCYADVDVVGTESSFTGGVAGRVMLLGASSRIKYCYATGRIAEGRTEGGIVALVPTGAEVVEDSYWDMDASGPTREDLVYGTGLSTSDLQGLTAMTATDWSTDHWDFGTNGDYPTLRRYAEDGMGDVVQGALLCYQPTDRVQCGGLALALTSPFAGGSSAFEHPYGAVYAYTAEAFVGDVLTLTYLLSGSGLDATQAVVVVQQGDEGGVFSLGGAGGDITPTMSGGIPTASSSTTLTFTAPVTLRRATTYRLMIGYSGGGGGGAALRVLVRVAAPTLGLRLTEGSAETTGADGAFLGNAQAGYRYNAGNVLGSAATVQEVRFSYAVEGMNLNDAGDITVTLLNVSGGAISLDDDAVLSSTDHTTSRSTAVVIRVPGGILEPTTYSALVRYSGGGLSQDVVLFITAMVRPQVVVDGDGDGLIDIRTIEELDNMRYNLAGTSYKAGAGSVGLTGGCPGEVCVGYELLNGLDFADAESYDAGAVDFRYRPLSVADISAVTGDLSALVVAAADGLNAGWVPVGYFNSDGDHDAFRCVFEGNGFTISNLYIRSGGYGVGLIGAATGDVELRGLTVSGAYVGRISAVGDDRPSFVGIALGSTSLSDMTPVSLRLQGCAVSGEIVAGNAEVGGLAGGVLGALVTDCSADVAIRVHVGSGLGANRYCVSGGLLGYSRGSVLRGCYATGEVLTTTAAQVEASGGLVGSLVRGERALITNCYATGSVRNTAGVNGAFGGGLVGMIGLISLVADVDAVMVANCYATGNVAGSATAGGLVGTAGGLAMANCYATGAISGGRAGGLVGEGLVDRVLGLTSCYATGEVVSSGSGGGLVGFDAGSAAITGCYWDLATTRQSAAGNNSGGVLTAGTGLSTAALQGLDVTRAMGWSEDDWAFGDGEQYPALRARDTNTSGDQIQGLLFCGQPSPRAQCSNAPQLFPVLTGSPASVGAATTIRASSATQYVYAVGEVTAGTSVELTYRLRGINLDGSAAITVTPRGDGVFSSPPTGSFHALSNGRVGDEASVVRVVLTIPSGLSQPMHYSATIRYAGGGLISPVVLTLQATGTPLPYLACRLEQPATAPAAALQLEGNPTTGYRYALGRLTAGEHTSVTFRYRLTGDYFVGTPVEVSAVGDDLGVFEGVYDDGGSSDVAAFSGTLLAGGGDIAVARQVVEVTFTLPSVLTSPTAYTTTITYSGGGLAAVTLTLTAIGVPANSMVVDGDGDGLIDIRTIEQLDNIRHNLAGTSYRAGAGAVGLTGGCPAEVCLGYELLNDLDFAVAGSYRAGAVDLRYRPLSDSNPMASGVREVAAADGLNAGWLPIGRITEGFTGTFEGNGFTIRNLYVRAVGTAGLFGVLGNNVRNNVGSDIRNRISNHVVNLHIAEAYVAAASSSSSSAPSPRSALGIVAGVLLGGRLADCSTSGLVLYNGNVGENAGGVAGGLVGAVQNGVVADCASTASVVWHADMGADMAVYIGGLIGSSNGGLVQNGYATGSVEVMGTEAGTVGAGGLIGGVISDIIGDDSRANALVQHCYATGSVQGSSSQALSGFGGLIGLGLNDALNDGLTLRNCYATGAVTSMSGTGGMRNIGGTGGLVGHLSTGTSRLENCYATGLVSGAVSGGLIGGTGGAGTVMLRNCYWDMETTAQSLVGGGLVSGMGSTGLMTAGLWGLDVLTATGWGEDAWSFGDGGQYPALRAYRTNTLGIQAQGLLFCDQPMPRAACVVSLTPRLITPADAVGAANAFTSSAIDRYSYDAGTVGNAQRFTFVYLLDGQRLDATDDITVAVTGSGLFTLNNISTFFPTSSGGVPVVSKAVVVTFIAPDAVVGRARYERTVTYSGGGLVRPLQVVLGVEVAQRRLVDGDGDGLIDIRTVEELDNIRHNLLGTSYKVSSGAVGEVFGCPDGVCRGYELLGDIDFADGRSYAGGSVVAAFRPQTAGGSVLPAGATLAALQAATNAGWLPIGDQDLVLGRVSGFASVFEGNGYAIRHLYVRVLSEVGLVAGLFGFADERAVIRNLRVERAYIAALRGASTADMVGVSAAILLADGVEHTGQEGLVFSITNCHVSGRVYSDGDAGGLIGFSSQNLIIRDCSIEAVLIGDRDIGGVLGHSEGNMVLKNTYVGGVGGSVTSFRGNAGGLLGTISEDTFIEGCVVSATVEASGLIGGGLVGVSTSSLGERLPFIIRNSYTTGSVTGHYAAGGLVGDNLGDAGVYNSYATGAISGRFAGGLLGINRGFLRLGANSHASGAIRAEHDLRIIGSDAAAGGLIGSLQQGFLGLSLVPEVHIADCYSTSSVMVTAHTAYAGGLLGGQLSGSTSLLRIYSTGDIQAISDTTAYAGGLVGYLAALGLGFTIDESYVEGSVEATQAGGLVGVSMLNAPLELSNSYAYVHSAVRSAATNAIIGGLIGRHESSQPLIVRNSYAAGELQAASLFSYVGGLLGAYNGAGATLRNCYAAGGITGGTAGGLVAQHQAGPLSIINCYASGLIEGRVGAGLVAEAVSGQLTITGSYWDIEATRQPTNAIGGGIPQTTMALQGLTAMTATGWKSQDWAFGTDRQYPALRTYEGADDVTGDLTQADGQLLCNQPSPRAQCTAGLTIRAVKPSSALNASPAIASDAPPTFTYNLGAILSGTSATFSYKVEGQGLRAVPIVVAEANLDPEADPAFVLENAIDNTTTLTPTLEGRISPSAGIFSLTVAAPEGLTEAESHMTTFTHIGGGLEETTSLVLRATFLPTPTEQALRPKVVAISGAAAAAVAFTRIDNHTYTYALGEVRAGTRATFSYAVLGYNLMNEVLDIARDGADVFRYEGHTTLQPINGGVAFEDALTNLVIQIPSSLSRATTYETTQTYTGGGLAMPITLTFSAKAIPVPILSPSITTASPAYRGAKGFFEGRRSLFSYHIGQVVKGSTVTIAYTLTGIRLTGAVPIIAQQIGSTAFAFSALTPLIPTAEGGIAEGSATIQCTLTVPDDLSKTTTYTTQVIYTGGGLHGNVVIELTADGVTDTADPLVLEVQTAYQGRNPTFDPTFALTTSEYVYDFGEVLMGEEASFAYGLSLMPAVTINGITTGLAVVQVGEMDPSNLFSHTQSTAFVPTIQGGVPMMNSSVQVTFAAPSITEPTPYEATFTYASSDFPRTVVLTCRATVVLPAPSSLLGVATTPTAFRLFPNPVAGILYVQTASSSASQPQAVRITLTNADGIVMGIVMGQHTYTASTQLHRLDLTDLPAGIYVVEIQTATHHTERHRILKQ